MIDAVGAGLKAYGLSGNFGPGCLGGRQVGPEQVIPYAPHLMFYAPDLTDDDIGGDRSGKESPVFMINAGSPSGYVIVPVNHHSN